MIADKIFVGRKAELEQFKKVLEDPKGQAVLVVGQAGMGKTWLINKMAELAENHPNFKCGCVRYEVTKEDSVDSRLAIMMDDAFEAASNPKVFWQGDDKSKRQWIALYKILEAIPSAGKVFEAIRGLAKSLKRDITKDSRQQFIDKLNILSKRMPKNGRAIFILDPEKYMKPQSDEAWAIIVRDLPEKIKLLFAQRPEDILVDSETFAALDNVSRIPEKRLDVLDKEAVEELLTQQIPELEYDITQVRKVLSRYEGHPYALQGSLDLLKAGTKLEELPQDPTGIASAQWKELCKRGKDAIRLFKAYAILEVGVPNDVATAASELDTDTLQSVLADNFLSGLLREEGYGKRIYHAILTDYIIEQIGDAEKRQYHSRAVEVYRQKLKDAREKQTSPDALAATRLAEHVLAAEGEQAFVLAFANECYESLTTLGLLDSAIGLSERALGYVDKGSKEEAAILGNLGVIYETRGDLKKAEQMHTKSLEIGEKLGWSEIMAAQTGNLGLIYKMRGDLDKAEQMHTKSMEIYEKLGQLEGMARQYGNLGLIYETRGDLDKAEQMHTKSLEISEKLGRLEGMAKQYTNIGLINRTRGDLNKAEQMHTKSLEIYKKLGHLEGMGGQYGNLGLIFQTRGDLDKAEQMYNKSLEISEKLGQLERVAGQTGNLGLIYRMRGDLDKAEQMHAKSLEIEEKLGRLEGISRQYGSLGLIHLMRGDLDKAEQMLVKSLEIEEKLGHLEGMATESGNLGLVYVRGGDLDKAEQMLTKSLEANEKLGWLQGMANQYSNLGTLYKQRGHIEKAREYWEKALALYEKIGMPHMVEKVQGLINQLKDK